jgi:hypothetical protein
MGISHFELHKKRVTASTVGGKSSGSPKKKNILHLSLRGRCVCMKTRGGPQATELNFSEKFILTHFPLNLRQSFKCYHSRNDLAAGFLKFNIAP